MKKNNLANRLFRKKCKFTTNQVYYKTCPSHKNKILNLKPLHFQEQRKLITSYGYKIIYYCDQRKSSIELSKRLWIWQNPPISYTK